jgi:hypothetical protein
MIAENIYSIAIHLPEKELEKLYIMLGKKVKQTTKKRKVKQSPLTREEAVQYLLKNVFSKKQITIQTTSKVYSTQKLFFELKSRKTTCK